jgi:hypothetical protein
MLAVVGVKLIRWRNLMKRRCRTIHFLYRKNFEEKCFLLQDEFYHMLRNVLL